MTGDINYPNLTVMTVTHILIAELLVLNCVSHLMNECRNSLAASFSLWKNNILITKASNDCNLLKGNLKQVNESERTNVPHYSHEHLSDFIKHRPITVTELLVERAATKVAPCTNFCVKDNTLVFKLREEQY